MSKIKKAQTKLTILMPDAAVRMSGRAQAAALDLTRGRIGGRYAGAPVMTLITIGRKTGRRRATAVIYGHDGDRGRARAPLAPDERHLPRVRHLHTTHRPRPQALRPRADRFLI